jgi:hypothetical protein
VALVGTDVSEDRITSVVTANVVLSRPIFVTLITEAIRSTETSVLTKATFRNIEEEGSLLN